VADKMMAIENKGIKVYHGDYSYYLEEHQKEMDKISVAAPSVTPKEIKKKVASPQPKRNTKKLELLEEEIAEYERKIKSIDGEMVEFALDANRLNELFQAKEALEQKLETCLEQWEAYQE
jgi:uncharacterized membrane protein YkoI